MSGSPTFQSAIPLRSICLRVSGAVAPSAAVWDQLSDRTLPQGSHAIPSVVTSIKPVTKVSRIIDTKDSQPIIRLKFSYAPIVLQFLACQLKPNIDSVFVTGHLWIERNYQLNFVICSETCRLSSKPCFDRKLVSALRFGVKAGDRHKILKRRFTVTVGRTAGQLERQIDIYFDFRALFVVRAARFKIDDFTLKQDICYVLAGSRLVPRQRPRILQD